MRSNPRAIALENIKFLSGSGLRSVSKQLVEARLDTTGLERELPYPAHGYEKASRAKRRLSAIGKTANSHGLAAFAIVDDDRAIGMATMQVGDPVPNASKYPNLAEVSYWHRNYGFDEAVSLGGTVIELLIRDKNQVPRPSNERIDNIWMVTLVDDEVKTKVCDTFGFEAVELATRYEIGDGVNEDRQLWMRAL